MSGAQAVDEKDPESGLGAAIRNALKDAKYTDIKVLTNVEVPNLYRFHWDCGRNGNITSILLLTDREIESHLGKSVCFGEVLGKHSHIDGTFDREDLTLLTTDQDFIAKALAYGLIPTGLNTIHAIDHPEEYQ